MEALSADIERGPAALADLLGGVLTSPMGRWTRWIDSYAVLGRRVAFVGLGSSLFASMDAAFALRAAGVAAWAEFASADGAPPAKDLVLVAVSASGKTREVVDARTATPGHQPSHRR